MRWPRPWHGTGPAGWAPFMRQYWRPLVLRARAEGFVEAGERWSLDGATAYVERNWGNGFPPVWWWGEAHDFGGDPVTVAFAGGPALGPLTRDGGRRPHRRPARAARRAACSPACATTSAPGRWVLRGRSLRHRVEIEASADPAAAHVLDVPVPGRAPAWSRGRTSISPGACGCA